MSWIVPHALENVRYVAPKACVSSGLSPLEHMSDLASGNFGISAAHVSFVNRD